MRAYNIHNILTSMPFGHYADYIDGQDEPVGFAQAMFFFIRETGIPKNKALEIVEDALQLTLSYPERIAQLHSLPQDYKTQLEKVHSDVRRRLHGLL
jgi:hypothetical protein